MRCVGCQTHVHLSMMLDITISPVCLMLLCIVDCPQVQGRRKEHTLSSESLRAGIGRADITPAPGTPQGGWGAQTHQRGAGADLPLLAKCLALTDGKMSAAIVDVDLIHLSPETEQKIANTASEIVGIPADHIRISCTHTHSGPNTFRLPVITQGLDMVLSYMESLPHRVAGAIWQAFQSLQPVRVTAGMGSCDINVNRRFQGPDGRWVVGRNPNGPVDRSVRVVRFDDLDERPLATILHYACHPTIMAWDNQLITPDFPGVAKRVVEDNVGGTCLFLQGATGNIGPRLGFTGDLSVYRRLGTILGLEASRIALNIETVARKTTFVGYQESGAPIALYREETMEQPPLVLSVRVKNILLPVRKMDSPELLAKEAERLRAVMNEKRLSGTEQEIRDATAAATQAGMKAERAKLVEGRSHLDRRLCVIRLGQIALISTQGEPFTETNARIVAQSPFPYTLFSGYSHGGVGYIPVREAFDQGGYEVETAMFSPDAADILADEAIALLHQVAGE